MPDQRILGARDSGSLAPATPAQLAPLILTVGLVLALSGWTDVALFYLPLQFGQNEWEFGTIAQTFDALPLPTLAMLLLATGLRARGGSRRWTRALAAACGLVVLVLVGLLLIFALDVPVAWKAMAHPTTGMAAPTLQVIAGIKRGIVKVLLFGVGYLAAYATLAVSLWRSGRTRA